jgi:hypothetical protein
MFDKISASERTERSSGHGLVPGWKLNAGKEFENRFGRIFS